MGLLWNCRSIAVRLLWDCCSTAVRSLWHGCASNMGLLWDSYEIVGIAVGIDVGPPWDTVVLLLYCSGIAVGLQRDCCWIA